MKTDSDWFFLNTVYSLLFQQVTFYGSSLTPGDKPPDGAAVTIEGLDSAAVVHSGGMTLTGTDGKMVSQRQLLYV